MAADSLVEVLAQWDKNSEFNKKARAWASKVSKVMRTTSPSDRLRSSIKYKTRTYQAKGPVGVVAFQFNRLGIYLEKGAGRGHGGAKGSKWYGPDGNIRKTNPASLGKMDKGNRPAKPFLQPAVDSNLDELADIVSDYAADMTVKQIDKLFTKKS